MNLYCAQPAVLHGLFYNCMHYLFQVRLGSAVKAREEADEQPLDLPRSTDNLVQLWIGYNSELKKMFLDKYVLFFVQIFISAPCLRAVQALELLKT